MPLRAVIFAAVSSPAQAADEKDSIPNQIARARDAIQRREWVEVHDPLIVPGLSRDIDFLHEAVEEIPAIADLTMVAKSGDLDLVVVRDYDRLARTRSLLTDITSFLARCGVQVYALDKPMEPVPPEQLARRRRGVTSASTVEAIAGLMAEGEVGQIVNRRFFGMNAVMRSGRWKHPTVIYGYTRLAEHATPEQPVYTDVPRIVPEEAAVVARIERLYLAGGLGSNAIARQLNLERVPSPTGKQWRGGAILRILHSPFYCGWIVWGTMRRATVLDRETGRFVSRTAPVKFVVDLAERLGRPANVFDLLERAGELPAHDISVVRGLHEPTRSEDTQRALYAELERRFAMGGRAAATAGRAPLFSGLLYCADCGSMLLAQSWKTRATIYYTCRARKEGGACGNKLWVREDRLLERVLAVLQEIARTPGAIDAYLRERATSDLEDLHQERDGLVQTLEGLEARRTRWDDAYEADVIGLADYGNRLAGLEQERAGIVDRLEVVERRLSQSQSYERRRDEIVNVIQGGIPTIEDRAALKACLRRIIARIIVDEGRIVEIVM